MNEKIILFKESTSKTNLLRNDNNSIIGVLDNSTLSCSIDYNLDSNHVLTVLIDGELAGNIINKVGEKQILKVMTQNGVYDYFVITGVDKTLTDVEIVARHWTMESTSSIFIVDSKPRNLNGLNMLTHLVRESEEYKKGKHFALDLELASNIDTLSSLNVFHSSLQNDLSKIQEYYKAEIRRIGFQLALMDYVGSKDVKYTVEYGINLIENTTEETYEVITGILPKGYDTLYGDIQYSSLLNVNTNKTGLTEVIEYKVRVRVPGEEEDEDYKYFDTEAQAKEELNRLAKLEFTENKIDEPIITFSTKYVDLGTVDGSTTNQTFLSVGDLVETKIPLYNLTIRTRVVQFIYNVLTGLIEDVTLSNNSLDDIKAPTISGINNALNNLPDIPSISDITSIAKKETTDYINGGIGGYVRIFPDEIYIMDQPNINNAVNLIRINKNGFAGSINGVNGTYSTSIQNNGIIVADQIKSGIFSSLNNRSWINMLDGTFNFANRLMLEADGNVLFTGRISNIGTSSGTEIRRGVLSLFSRNAGGNLENVGGVTSSAINTTDSVNGLSIATTTNGEYIDIGSSNSDDIGAAGSSLTPYLRIITKQHQIFNNFVGTQFVRPANVNGYLYFGSTANANRSRITTFGDENLALIGKEATRLYILNDNNTFSAKFEVTNQKDSVNCDVHAHGNMSMNFYEIRRCPNVSNTFSNPISRKVHDSSALYTQEDDTFRYIFKEVETNKDNKIILNIPNEYKGRKYTIVSVVKFGFGDYMVSYQDDSRFIIETDRSMKMNIEISIE